MNSKTQKILFSVWFVATFSFLGSLFFSEIMRFIPCVLCWYQRICMYPLVLILLIGLLKKDGMAIIYALPLAILGWLLAGYQILLQTRVIPASLSPCVKGVPCATKYINWLGFISIPVLSFTAFTIILGGLIYCYKKGRKE